MSAAHELCFPDTDSEFIHQRKEQLGYSSKISLGAQKNRGARGFRMFPRKPLREQPYRAPSPLAGKGATGESGDSPANCGPGFPALSCGASVAARAPATIGEPQLSPSLQPSPPLRLPSSPNRLPSPTQPRRRRARPPPLPAPSARALQTPPAQPPLHPVQTPKAPGKTGRRQLR